MRGSEKGRFIPLGIDFIRSGFCGKIGPEAVIVYAVLRAHCWRRGADGTVDELAKSGHITARMTVSDLQFQSGVPERSVRRVLEKLRAIGWVKTVSDGRGLTFILGTVVSVQSDIDGSEATASVFFADSKINDAEVAWRIEQSRSARLADQNGQNAPQDKQAIGQPGRSARPQGPPPKSSPIPMTLIDHDRPPESSKGDAGSLQLIGQPTLAPKRPTKTQLDLGPPPDELDPVAAGLPSLEIANGLWVSSGGPTISRWTEHRTRAYIRLCEVLRPFMRADERMIGVLKRYFQAILSAPCLNGGGKNKWKLDFNWAIGADRQWNAALARAGLEERIRKALDGDYAKASEYIHQAPLNPAGVNYGAPRVAPIALAPEHAEPEAERAAGAAGPPGVSYGGKG